MRPHTRTHCSRKGECEGEVSGHDSEQWPACSPCLQQTRCLGARTGHRQLALVELPAELLIKILEYMTFKENSTVRLVCRRLNELCAARLNSSFNRLQNNMLVRFQSIKSQMPRRESARRNHPLARECDIVETLHMRLTLLQMTFGKHIERKHICFFPGEILDEVIRILSYIALTQPLGRAYKVTDELFDLSTMAMEYFKENIEPSLPEITYFGSDFLDFTPPFSSPSKRLQNPLTTVGFDSPISSRASAVGSSCSEPPLPYTGMDGMEGEYEEGNTLGRDSAPQSNMVLRKRIRRIRAGMKKYNTQLDEVKRELKTCKSKMDSQSKQVSEYASRLDDYDKKFEENSRKFGTLLTELNKCKTELQYYRSRSHLMQCLNCGSSLTDPPSESPDQPPNELGGHQLHNPQLHNPDGFHALGVDKQALVEDWLNPEPGETPEPPTEGGFHAAAPTVQHAGPCIAGPSHQPQLKMSKTEESYQRSGPGSPGYTRHSPRSPGGAGEACGAPRTAKRKSKEGSGPAGVSCSGKMTRCKRPKVAASQGALSN